MLMDCDISVIEGRHNEETICDTESPKKTVQLINEAQTNQDKMPADSKLKHLLKKIEGASKIQMYLLQHALPAANTDANIAIINNDILKLSTYINKCCTQCLKVGEMSSLVDPKNISSPSQTKSTLGNIHGLDSSLHSEVSTNINAPSTPDRVEMHSLKSSEDNRPPSTPVSKPFDRLITKLMSPSSATGKVSKNKPQSSLEISPAFQSKDSISQKLYSEKDSKQEANQVNEENFDNDCEEVLKSIDDWSLVKEFLTHKSCDYASQSKIAESVFEENQSDKMSCSPLLRNDIYFISDSSHEPSTAGCTWSFNGDDESVDSRPPSPPLEIEEEQEEDNEDREGRTVHSLDHREDCDEGFQKNLNCCHDGNVVLSDTSMESSEESPPPPNESIESSERESSPPLRDSVIDSPGNEENRRSSPVKNTDVISTLAENRNDKPDSDSIIIGHPEITWSTEFNHSNALSKPGISFRFDPCSNFESKTTDMETTEYDDDFKLTKSIECLRKDIHYSSANTTLVVDKMDSPCDSTIATSEIHKENSTNNSSITCGLEGLRDTTSLLQGLRRKSTSSQSSPKSTHQVDSGEMGGEKIGDYRVPRNQLFQPRDNTSHTPGNHLNLRQSLQLAQNGTGI